MVEVEISVLELARLEDPGLGERCERLVDRLPGEIGERSDRERAPDHRGERERVALALRQPLEPCRQQRFDRARRREVAVVETPALLRFVQAASITEVDHELLEKERVAARGVDERRKGIRRDLDKAEQGRRDLPAGLGVDGSDLEGAGLEARAG